MHKKYLLGAALFILTCAVISSCNTGTSSDPAAPANTNNTNSSSPTPCVPGDIPYSKVNLCILKLSLTPVPDVKITDNYGYSMIYGGGHLALPETPTPTPVPVDFTKKMIIGINMYTTTAWPVSGSATIVSQLTGMTTDCSSITIHTKRNYLPGYLSGLFYYVIDKTALPIYIEETDVNSDGTQTVTTTPF
jgi:hypothetical protein